MRLVANGTRICMVAGMPDAELRTDDSAAFPIPEPPASRRRLRGPIQQTIDLFFVERRGGTREYEDPVYDGQGQPKRRPARPGSMLNMVV